jgi:hypothetical protein
MIVMMQVELTTKKKVILPNGKEIIPKGNVVKCTKRNETLQLNNNYLK